MKSLILVAISGAVMAGFAIQAQHGAPQIGSRSTSPSINAAINARAAVVDRKSEDITSLLNIGNFVSAELLAREDASAFPDSPKLQSLLGEVLLREGKNKEALVAFEKSQALVEEQGISLRLQVLKLRSSGLPTVQFSSENITQFFQGVTGVAETLPPLKGKGIEASWLLAIALREDLSSQDAAAVYYYQEALKLAPGNAFANARLGKIAIRNHRFADAAGYLTIAAAGAKGAFGEEIKRDLDLAAHMVPSKAAR